MYAGNSRTFKARRLIFLTKDLSTYLPTWRVRLDRAGLVYRHIVMAGNASCKIKDTLLYGVKCFQIQPFIDHSKCIPSSGRGLDSGVQPYWERNRGPKAPDDGIAQPLSEAPNAQNIKSNSSLKEAKGVSDSPVPHQPTS